MDNMFWVRLICLPKLRNKKVCVFVNICIGVITIYFSCFVKNMIFTNIQIRHHIEVGYIDLRFIILVEIPVWEVDYLVLGGSSREPRFEKSEAIIRLTRFRENYSGRGKFEETVGGDSGAPVCSGVYCSDPIYG